MELINLIKNQEDRDNLILANFPVNEDLNYDILKLLSPKKLKEIL